MVRDRGIEFYGDDIDDTGGAGADITDWNDKHPDSNIHLECGRRHELIPYMGSVDI